MKQAYHHSDLRNALIDEALKVLAESGIAGLTLRELARRIGVTHTAPYAHFADKDALLRDVSDVGFDRLCNTVSSAVSAERGTEERFIAMAIAYVEFARTHPELYRLMFVAPEVVAGQACEMSKEGEQAFGVLLQAIGQLGYALPAPLEEIAVSAWAFLHGVAMLEIDSRIKAKTTMTSVQLATLATKVFLRGLREPNLSARYDTEKSPVEPHPLSL